jgi:hypothetical protein
LEKGLLFRKAEASEAIDDDSEVDLDLVRARLLTPSRDELLSLFIVAARTLKTFSNRSIFLFSSLFVLLVESFVEAAPAAGAADF